MAAISPRCRVTADAQAVRLVPLPRHGLIPWAGACPDSVGMRDRSGPRPRPQAPQFDFDEDQMRSFFQNMMGPQDTSEMTALQDRIKELEGQISGFQKPAGVEEETTVTETETTPTPTPTPTPQVPTPTPQDRLGSCHRKFKNKLTLYR